VLPILHGLETRKDGLLEDIHSLFTLATCPEERANQGGNAHVPDKFSRAAFSCSLVFVWNSTLP
jgi:hypothetical protein